MNMGLAEGDAVGAHLMVDLYREDATGQPTGSPLKAYLSTAGVSPATSHKALKNIENL